MSENYRQHHCILAGVNGASSPTSHRPLPSHQFQIFSTEPTARGVSKLTRKGRLLRRRHHTAKRFGVADASITRPSTRGGANRALTMGVIKRMVTLTVDAPRCRVIIRPRILGSGSPTTTSTPHSTNIQHLRTLGEKLRQELDVTASQPQLAISQSGSAIAWSATGALLAEQTQVAFPATQKDRLFKYKFVGCGTGALSLSCGHHGTKCRESHHRHHKLTHCCLSFQTQAGRSGPIFCSCILHLAAAQRGCCNRSRDADDCNIQAWPASDGGCWPSACKQGRERGRTATRAKTFILGKEIKRRLAP